MAKITVEGWRFLPHSFANVNMFQCLEFLKRPEIELFHRDIPFIGRNWKPVYGLLHSDDEQALKDIPEPPENECHDVSFHAACPFDFSVSKTQRTVTFATCEFGKLTSDVINGRDLIKNPIDRDIQIITPTRWSKDGLVRSGINEKQIHIIPHGIDPGIFHPPSVEERQLLRKKLGWEDYFIFLNIGAMTSNKGIPSLLASLYDICPQHPQARLVLKGLDSLYASSQALSKNLEDLPAETHSTLRHHVAYMGGDLTFEDIANLYKAADAYVAPYQGEGFNMPVLEAIACGLPVICTAGGSTDDFTDGEFALAINSQRRITGDPDNPDSIFLQPDRKHLVSLMLEVIENRHWMDTARTRGPEYVLDSLTWKHVVDKLQHVMLA